MDDNRPQRPVTVVTGATGFVGGELVKQLLLGSERELVCPVRADDGDHANSRGERRLGELLGPQADLYSDRVTWVQGDLEQSNLGWSILRWNTIAARTVEIFHCAASVSFDLDLDEAHRINVDGTIHIHDLAVAAARAHGGFERFHHVSTAYVSGRRLGTVGANHLPADRAWAFRNTYERTKARAERRLRQRACAAVPVTIHRPSIVAGRTDTGETTSWNVLYVPMNMAAKGALPAFTGRGDAPLDSVGIDYVVAAIVHFAATDTGPLQAHHLTAGTKAFTVDDLTAVTRVHGAAAGLASSETRLLNRFQWAVLTAGVAAVAGLPKFATRPQVVRNLNRRARLIRRGLRRCGVYLPYSRVRTRFDASDEHAELAGQGIVMPDGLDYLNRIVGYAVATNFGRKSPSHRAVVAEPAVAATGAVA